MALHMIKLVVGAATIEDLLDWRARHSGEELRRIMHADQLLDDDLRLASLEIGAAGAQQHRAVLQVRAVLGEGVGEDHAINRAGLVLHRDHRHLLPRALAVLDEGEADARDLPADKHGRFVLQLGDIGDGAGAELAQHAFMLVKRMS